MANNSNMSLADELNQIGDYGYIKFSDLNVGQKHKVYALKVHDSNFNNIPRKCVRVDIDNGYLILPERYDRMVHTLESAKVENLYISYHGCTKTGRLDIRFSHERA